MRSNSRLPSFLLLVTWGCASSPSPAPTQAPASEPPPAATPAPSAAAPAPADFPRVAGDGFAFAMPGEPKVDRQTVTIPAGDVSAASWTATDAGVRYTLSYADFPEAVIAARPAEAMLAEGRDGVVNQIKGTVGEEKAIELEGGHPGKAFTVTSADATMKVRNYLVGNRLYTLIATHHPSVQAARAEEFLDSLELTPAPAPAPPAATPGG
jgi:hypothetical protein